MIFLPLKIIHSRSGIYSISIYKSESTIASGVHVIRIRLLWKRPISTMRFYLSTKSQIHRGLSTEHSQLKLGIVGTQETIQGVQDWLQRERGGIQAKDSRLSNLF